MTSRFPPSSPHGSSTRTSFSVAPPSLANKPLGSSSPAYWQGSPAGSSYTTSKQLGFSTSSSPNQTGSPCFMPRSSERLISSTILKEEYLNNRQSSSGGPGEENVRFVEVPVVQEVIKRVPRKEYVEVEKRVPKYEVEWVERIIDVPQVQYVDKIVEVPQIQEVIRQIPVRQIVDVPREVCKYVPRVETRMVEKEIEVPGEVIYVPITTQYEKKVIVPRYQDVEVTCVVAQSLRPVIVESDTHCVDVEMREFNPCLVPVDVLVPKPVARHLIAHRKTEEHKVVEVPAGHYNAMLRQINPDLTEKDLENRFQMGAGGVIPISYGVRFVPITGSEE